MRSIKMMGMTPDIFNTVQDSRTHELERSAHFRWFVAFMNLFGALPRLLSAPFAFALFVFSEHFFSENGLSSARAFTTLSLLELLTTPLGKVLQSIPQFTAAFGCLDRIQNYLLLHEQAETRELGPVSLPPHSADENIASKNGDIWGVPTEKTRRVTVPAVKLSGVTIQYKSDSPKVLKDVDLEIEVGSLVMIIGPVGCGKTTLLQAIVGALAPAEGSLRLKDLEIAYCQQTPWLANTTIRKNILGQTPYDEIWYSSVRDLCALEEDIATFADGDEQLIGTGGITLSGGQKQRLVRPKRPCFAT